jgi:hypothetical protein
VRAVFFPGSKPPGPRPFNRATEYGVSWYNDLTEEERRWRTPNDEQCEEITAWHMTRMIEQLREEERGYRGRIVGALWRRSEARLPRPFDPEVAEQREWDLMMERWRERRSTTPDRSGS